MTATLARPNTRSWKLRWLTAAPAAAALALVGLAVCLADQRPRQPLDAPGESPAPIAAGATRPDGKELFTREWLPRDPRAHGGDGLGPVFNDSSCVGCHNQGGVGGGGPKAKNVNIVTPFGGGTPNGVPPHALGPSFVLHHSGTDEEFVAWRSGVVAGQFAQAQFVQTGAGDASLQAVAMNFLNGGGNRLTQRQTTALFGAGLIDAIPQRVLEEAAARKLADYPEVTGRVSPLEKGGVGRFGWKAQIAGLEEFVLTACAVELGLQVPGKEQPPLPYKKDYRAPGLDMNRADCDALVKFIRDLPAPTQRRPDHPAAAKYIAEGQELFAAVGCAACHTPKLGDVDGIYSDLLLHDLGPQLSDASSSYGVLRPTPSPAPPPATSRKEVVQSAVETSGGSRSAAAPVSAASAAEWRTPPLWGVRDSAPYLHDGRADTLEAAIALHGGEGDRSRTRFAALKLEERQKVLAFLKTLAAPEL